MQRETVKNLPIEAFQRGVKRLNHFGLMKNVLELGLDCEYNSYTQEIIAYQLSDGTNDAWMEAYQNITWRELYDWVITKAREWGHDTRNANTIILSSFFSTAELSHIQDFHVEAEVRRVSPQQVFNTHWRANHRHNLVVFDLYHFFNTSLAKVAETWGEAKLEYDTTQVDRSSLNDPKFIEYMLWDARICARILKKFRHRAFTDYGIDILRYGTPASFAMAVYRSHFLKTDLPPPRPRVRKQAWRSLWGGRAEAYARGDFLGDYTLRDVKSLYPNGARLLRYLPTADDWIERRGDPVNWQGLCSVSFRFPPHVRYPCLPVINQGKLIFPLKGRSDCTLEEARVARTLGAELHFHRVMEYETGDTSLAEFMDAMMAKKDHADETGDKPGRDLAKLQANSLIGKFSQNRGESDVEDFKKHAEEVGMPLDVVMSPKWHHPDKPNQKHRIGGYIMPEWSALILGKARAIMAQLLNSVGESLICSTDSLLIPSNLNGLVDQTMKQIGVHLDNKSDKCEECGGPGRTARVRIIRNRVYVAECPHGRPVFMANHGIHMRKMDAYRFMLGDHNNTYVRRRLAGLKTSIKAGVEFFSETHGRMSFKGEWDQKRHLEEDGTTRPWRSRHEHDDATSKGIRGDMISATLRHEP